MEDLARHARRDTPSARPARGIVLPDPRDDIVADRARGDAWGELGVLRGDERRRFRDYALASRRRGGRWHPRVSVHGWMASPSDAADAAVPRRRDIAR